MVEPLLRYEFSLPFSSFIARLEPKELLDDNQSRFLRSGRHKALSAARGFVAATATGGHRRSTRDCLAIHSLVEGPLPSHLLFWSLAQCGDANNATTQDQ